MKERTPEQLKGQIRSFAEKRNLQSQEVLQMFLLERVLDRLSKSKYKDNFILKGGLLISSMIGIAERTTMDMDTTVTGISMEEKQIENIIRDIILIDVGDGIEFTFEKLEPIREDDDYNNFRAYFVAHYGKIANKMKIDITTGDAILSFSCHCLRHTFCSRLVENGEDVKTVHALMGHANYETTLDVYAEISDMKKKEVMNNLGTMTDFF